MTRRSLPAGLAGVVLVLVTAALAAGATDPVSAAGSAGGAGYTSPAPAARFVVASTGNEARYRVREQLAGLDFPSDAVGATTAITGALVIDESGSIVGAESRLVVDVTTLASDRDRRDNYLRRRTLETATHPTVTLAPTAVRGLSLATLPVGERSFELLADLTVKGVTRPTTWTVTARFADDRVTGSAATAFTFEQFGLAKPRVASVLSVADTIRLEYDFTLVRESAGER